MKQTVLVCAPAKITDCGDAKSDTLNPTSPAKAQP